MRGHPNAINIVVCINSSNQMQNEDDDAWEMFQSEFPEEEDIPICFRVIKPRMIVTLNFENIKAKGKNRNRKKLSQSKSKKTTEDLQRWNSTVSKMYREVFDGKDRVRGLWRNGVLEGEAEIDYANGAFFQGIFEKGHKVSGKMFYENGYEYVGQFLSQQFHGQGSLLMPNQMRITGQWENGKIVGNTKIEYSKGVVYYGPVQNFLPSEKGFLYLPGDRKYVGQFQKGMANGFGDYFQKGTLMYRGIWRDNKFIISENDEISRHTSAYILNFKASSDIN